MIDRREVSLPRMSLTSRLLALCVCAIGVIVVIGWIGGIERLRVPFPNTASVKLSTGIGFGVLGLAIWNAVRRPGFTIWAYSAVALWGAVHLLQEIVDIDLGIDQLFVEFATRRAQDGPGRMAPTTAAAFVFCGSGGLLSLRGHGLRTYVGQWLTSSAAVIATLAGVGYAYGVDELYWIEGFSAMALPSSIVFFLASIAILLARSDIGIGLMMGLRTSSGTVFRSALPAAIFVPLLVGWIAILGAREFWWTQAFALSATTVASSVLLLLVLYNAVSRARETEAVLMLRDRALESTEVGIIIVNAVREDQPVEEVNAAFESITGFRASDIVGKNCRVLNRLARDQPGLDEMRTALRDKVSCDVVLLNHRKDGSPFWNRVVISPVCSAFGNVTHFVGVCRDVSGDIARQREREELLESTTALQMSAEKALQARDVFLGVVSHELRSPLHSARLWAEILREGDSSIEPRQIATHLIRSIDAQSRLVADLLDVSRFSTENGIELELSTTNLVQVVQNVIADLRPSSDEAGLDLRATTPTAAVFADVDADRIQQVMHNLIENAIKFTKAGGWVRVDLNADVQFARIQVVDSGIGIEAEDLPHVFSRFWRRSDSGTASGLGLGLSIVEHLVARHGGEIEVASDGAQRGSTFSISLPLSEAESRDVSTPARRGDTQRTRVALVVDDESSARSAMKRILEAIGFEVFSASTAAEAYELALAHEISLLVSDIWLPHGSGHELIERLRLAESFGVEPVAIAVSGQGAPTDRRRAIEAGFDAFLAKPVSPSTLRELIAALFAPAGDYDAGCARDFDADAGDASVVVRR